MRVVLKNVAIFYLFSMAANNGFSQEFTYYKVSVLSVISDIEDKTPFRFLYREALIADITVSFNADEDSLFDFFSSALSTQKLGLKVDKQRNKALIFESQSKKPTSHNTLSGFVIDDDTGERIPYVTLTWKELGILKGVITNVNGQFDITIPSKHKEITLSVSSLGYSNENLYINMNDGINWEELPIRLKTLPYSGKEIIVRGINFYTPNDTILDGLLKIGTFSPLGESNAIRSLQMLPAVSMSSAINDGINIRGSASDGLQILLDGQTVYNHSHLFGMLDAMNADVLKSSGFFYDITPAQYQAPLGGTLSLITRTGSLNNVRSSLVISNTAVKTILEGPIQQGKSSWLISGRWSYLDDINWFNNSDMIDYGLDINRDVDLTVDPRFSDVCFDSEFKDDCIKPNQREFILNRISVDEVNFNNTDATFYDVHSKLYFETASGTQFFLSGYLGNDEAKQDYSRNEGDINTENATLNKWDNAFVNGQIYTQLGNKFNAHTSIGYTIYSSQYYTDDFEFSSFIETDNGVRLDTVLILPLNLENKIQQFDVRQTFNKQLPFGVLEMGVSYSDFNVKYKEIGETSNSFQSKRTSQLLDVFQQLDINASDKWNVSIGNRFHYFSNGNYLRISPRLKSTFYVSKYLSMATGFSRNHQFINQLQITNINSNDFWILTNEDQPPPSVNYFTAGLYYSVNPNFYIQAESYYKKYNNLRVHELKTGSASVSFQNTDIPWFYKNKGISRGIEFLIKNTFRSFSLSSGYTYSIAKLKNETKKGDSDEYLFNNGEFFYADWDRRHQVSLTSTYRLNKAFSFFSSWTFGTGTPARVNYIDKRLIEERLPNYSRMDISLQYKHTYKSGVLDASLSICNVLNRSNVWYSQYSSVNFETVRGNNRKFNLYTHVFDLGIQPSFNLTFNF